MSRRRGADVPLKVLVQLGAVGTCTGHARAIDSEKD